ncbi:hypothetical protein [Sutcliffiella rhizosphaerae]|uniref:Swarming motility protein SwrB n=1 Tax=Sutcliffiella rhizosphaerae TaxID=2880967 RepID=A0ABN8A7F2_9BACI|nr:hypothetical protein [Sutcliffiella rhizosphaerae]CAG9619686.1 hypothetical protein BACCIP111883_00454 [Sutcliffiella rhizosphaerae]
MIIFTVINFVLILLVILFVIILYIKLSNVQQLEQEYRSLIKEAEESISGYILELKEENDRFLSKITKEEETPSVFDTKEGNLTGLDISELLAQNDSHDKKVDLPRHNDSFGELELKDQVKVLEEKGYTFDEIAKKLNKGKTEIELLMKFRQ